MKKIGVISDTHGYLDPKIDEYFKSCDEIWHAGDIGSWEIIESLSNLKPVRAVFGNIDGPDIYRQLNEDLEFDIEGLKVLITHIGGYPPRYTSRAINLLRTISPDLFICGHSHNLRIMKDPKFDNMLYINPGAAGKQGFHTVRTVVRFNITESTIENVEVIELGPRTEKKQRPSLL